MNLSFIFPAALWLLLILVPLWALTLLAPRRLGPIRFWLSLLLRTAMVFALVLGLSGVQLVRSIADVTTVFVLDRSESIAPEAASRAETFVREALETMTPEDRGALVLFGENALVDRVPSAEPGLTMSGVAPDGTETNIQDAVELGLSLFPADSNKRIVLLSDGGENVGSARTAADLALARGASISYVDINALTGASEALVTGMSAPASVREGQSFELAITVDSSAAQTAHLRVFEGEQVIAEQDVQLQAGTNTIPVSVPAQLSGFQRYRAEITPQSDAQPKNNVAEALVQVEGPPTVLLVEGTPGEAQPLASALAAAQVNAQTVAPEAMPADLAALGAYDATVLVNVPASALPVAAMANLPTYVRDLGKGLIMIGGERSYGIGGYGQTPLEEALPVYTDVRDITQHPKVAIIFVLDKSRSMQNCHCNGPNRETDTDRSYFETGRMKLDIGKDAVLQSVATLTPQDSVGIVTFDGAAYWTMPPQNDVTVDEVQAVLAPIPPDGIDTNIGAGLQSAQEALRQSDAVIKHAVLLTDGWGEGVDPLEVAASMRAEGMTLSVIADGKGSSPALQQLADAGGGRYLPAQNPEDIPQLFVNETIHTAGNFMVETQFVPRYGAASPVLTGLESGLPSLYGYNATTAKQTAETVLYGVDNAPVLAQWQFGLGRSIAWTSDTKGQWAKDWLTWPEFPRFAAQLVGWVLPTASNTLLTPEVRQENGQTTISATVPGAAAAGAPPLSLQATVIGTDGSRQEVPLAQTGPGTYSATVPSPQQGSYLVQVVGVQNGQPIAQETAGLSVPYSAEYGKDQHNPALLEQLAKTTGGAQLSSPAEAFAHTLSGATRAQEVALPMVLLALLLLPIDVVVRRLFAPTNARPHARR